MSVKRVITLALVFMFLFSSIAFADSIEERFHIKGLLDDIDSAATIIVATVRTIASVLTAVLVVSVGFTLWRCRDGQTLELVKTRIYFIFLGLFIIFLTEPIVKFVLRLMGG